MSELTKEQLKGPDKFQKFSKQLVDWTRKNQKAVFGAAVALLVIGIAYAGFDMYQQRVEEKARLALYDAQKIKEDLDQKSEELKTKTDEAKKPADRKKKDDKAAADKKAKKEDKPPSNVTQADLDGLKQNALTAYQKVLASFPGTSAAHIAALQSSQMLLDDKKLDEASKVFDSAKEPTRKHGILLGAFLSQKAKVFAEKGDCENAVREWEKVIGNPSLNIWHGDSLVKAGVCYEKLQKKDKAIELYKKASNEHAESDAGRTAKKFLILAEREPKG